MDGVINVYKEHGYTSHDVVAKLRGILHMKKIGHTGTLDPDAVGVLPVCLGKATKLCELLTDWTKTYEAVLLLGRVTDTQDISGKIMEEHKVDVDECQIMDAVTSFVGDYKQVPPMYSAIKHNGKKLYELARAGIEIEREPRTVRIDAIKINEMHLLDEEKTVRITVSCSKGTYIRTLCHDIGGKLGCGACMIKLARTRVGQFVMDDSLTLNQISAFMIKGELENNIYPIWELFHYPKLVVPKDLEKLLYNGNSFQLDGEFAGKYNVFDAQDKFVGIYEYVEGRFVVVKMFYNSDEEMR